MRNEIYIFWGGNLTGFANGVNKGKLKKGIRVSPVFWPEYPGGQRSQIPIHVWKNEESQVSVGVRVWMAGIRSSALHLFS